MPCTLYTTSPYTFRVCRLYSTPPYLLTPVLSFCEILHLETRPLLETWPQVHGCRGCCRWEEEPLIVQALLRAVAPAAAHERLLRRTGLVPAGYWNRQSRGRQGATWGRVSVLHREQRHQTPVLQRIAFSCLGNAPPDTGAHCESFVHACLPQGKVPANACLVTVCRACFDLVLHYQVVVCHKAEAPTKSCLAGVAAHGSAASEG